MHAIQTRPYDCGLHLECYSLRCIHMQYTYACNTHYGVATVSRIDKVIGLFCRIASLLQGSFAKEAYNLIDLTNQSHPVYICMQYRLLHLECHSLQCIHMHMHRGSPVIVKHSFV